MTTRLYLPNTTEAPSVAASPSSDWEDTSALARTVMRTVTTGHGFTTFSFSDADASDKDCLLYQFVSPLLVPAQTISGSQAIKVQIRGQLSGSGNSMYVAAGLRVVANDGSLRKELVSVTRDDNLLIGLLLNRQFTSTSAAGDYTTVIGDCLVLEVGAGGDPSVLGNHSFSLSIGDSGASDLPEDNTESSALNPWLQLADTLSFISPDLFPQWFGPENNQAFLARRQWVPVGYQV